jgi:hypothetical protein
MFKLTVIIITLIISNFNLPSQAQTNLGPNQGPNRLLLKKLNKRSKNWSTIINQYKSQTITNSPSNDPKYIIPPRQAAPDQLDPLSTSLILNETPISHRTEWEFSASKPLADNTEIPVFFRGIIKLTGEVTENLTRQNIYTVDQKARYLQIRNVPYKRTVTTTTIQPQTMNGLQIQMSLIGNCIKVGIIQTNQLCTYTPGLVTDRNSLDPDFFVPTRIDQTSNVGDIVTPASIAAITQPGFQLGANGQSIGLDLYFPNTGAYAGNSQSQETTIKREEDIDATFATTFSQVRQVIKANHEKAVLGRTTRGFTAFLNNGENSAVNLAIQGGSLFLPDYIPELPGSDQPVNTLLNPTLFQAANNARLPSNSLTIYNIGLGEAKSLTGDITKASDIPPAKYHSIWLGLSPVIDRTINDGDLFYQPTGPQSALRSGGEGGQNENISFVSSVNQNVFSTANLENFYTQVYLNFLQQDINFVQESIYEEKTTYYPHLSLTGNKTGPDDILRYYTGVIFSEKTMAYAGLDYTKNTASGWNLNTGAIGYINPDRDYYSQIWGRLAKRIDINPQTNITFAGGITYALDQPQEIDDIYSQSQASELFLRSNIKWGIFAVGAIYYFGDILPNSYDDRLAIDFSIRPIDNLEFSAYFAPIDQTSSRSLWGLGINWQLQNKYNSPTLSLSWQNQEYDYGQDNFGNDLLVTDNVFTIFLRFGSPLNPFQR